jgi:molybdate/tungstate transport system substrate-binding protein
MHRLILAVSAMALLGWAGCDSKPAKTQLRVFMADSLLRPMNAVADAFAKQNPDIELVQIPSGSVLAAKKIIDGNDAADVLAVADSSVIERLMRPVHADWYICFATNEIGIAYSDASKGAPQLTADNWFDILSREDVTVAAANPLHDPCGYWTELCWRLADIHYPAAGGTITGRMVARCGVPGDRRGDSEQLLQLVESSGGIDYAFVYRSQAMQHHLPFLRLPAEVSLGDPALAESYRRAYVEISGADGRPLIRRTGEPIVYAITIPKVARHPDLAARYLSFIMSPAGRRLLIQEYMQVVEQPWTCDPQLVPPGLRAGLRVKDRVSTTTTSPGGQHGG